MIFVISSFFVKHKNDAAKDPTDEPLTTLGIKSNSLKDFY